MPVCPVFAVGLAGKCGTGEQRLQGGPDCGRLSAAAAHHAQLSAKTTQNNGLSIGGELRPSFRDFAGRNAISLRPSPRDIDRSLTSIDARIDGLT
jgi:hypothetical protein